jgi:hypothetical protein
MFEKELRFLHAGLDELSAYLQQEQVFWPLSGVDAFTPRLTLSGLLLSLKRAEGLAQTPAKQAQVSQIARKTESTRQRHRSLWERKAAQELGMRWRMWQNYLMDYRQNPADHADEYRYQIRLRVMVTLLAEEARPEIRLAKAIAEADAWLKATLVPTDFIWEAPLRTIFPQPAWWYLYGVLKPSI